MLEQDQLTLIAQSSSYANIHTDIYQGFMSNALFKTPLEISSRDALLNLSNRFSDLITPYYDTVEVGQLINLFHQSNVLFIEYIYYLANSNPLAQTKITSLKQNSQKGARLFSQICPYWRELEWNGMLSHQVDLLQKMSLLLFNNTIKDFQKQIALTYNSYTRLIKDMSSYFSGGIISDKTYQNTNL